jgi:selenocysteine-specific elongation factor
MPVVGTAGHVDHGKSTLVQALTGRDPDRWDEEKRRGLTIDLGFAWTTMPSGISAGFVDVPGHERFIKNMLAGVDAIDVAVFVVAADEGWMPQSEEHLAVLDLLGITRGIVAITRADLVDEDGLELAMLEVEEQIAGTSLEGSPLIPTSIPDGRGLDELRTAIDEALAASSDPDLARPRMWIDRAFTIGGAGTVVTGTLVDGSVADDDTLALFPGGIESRVRSIQSHEETVDSVGPGNRTALNLVGLDREDITRGSMLGRPDHWDPTSRFVADVRTVRSLDAPLREQGSYHLHVGSGSWPTRIQLLEGDRLDGTGAVVMTTETRIPLKSGDRFILREVGRQAVVGGGRILDPMPPRRTRDMSPIVARLRTAPGVNEVATILLEARGVEEVTVLSAHTGGGTPEAELVAEGRAYSRSHIEHLRGRARDLIGAFHEASPLRPGMPKASLATRLHVEPEDLDSILAEADDLQIRGPVVRSTDFGGELRGADRAAWEALEAAMRDAGYAPPRRKELDVDRELLHALIRNGSLVEVSDDLVYLPETLDAIEEAVGAMHDGFTVADFRDAMGVSRKYAVPLLEWMDDRGVTSRQGDGRVVRRSQPDEPSPGDAPSR